MWMKGDREIGNLDSNRSITTRNLEVTQIAGKHRIHMDMTNVNEAVSCEK